MKVVFLDSDSLPVSIARPAWVSDWQDRPDTTPDQVVEAARDADAVITNKVRIGRAELEQLPNLRFICVAATGYDCIDLAACHDFAVTVCNVPAYSAQSVAESVIASIFALRRQLFAYQAAALRDWPDSRHLLGIIGRGGIGLATARLASALGMQLLFAEHRGVVPVRKGYQSFETVLAQSDVISLHCPLTERTRHLIGALELAQMKPGALLINTARGPLVDEAAVLDALDSGRLGGAALDVLCQEPPPADHLLLSSRHANLIVTPHVAWASQSSLQRLADGILGNLQGYYLGNLINLVS
jgi:glycerate dehydrogenase